ncbi:hypothetical protein CKO25_19505 [Thiocapsa imhoffii]|uniref:Sulfotransferase domain-containing protein n=1 Tax=Thiocapsa imhoffii TaxID=382777 RepID=A0A9X0WL89_9GAMM|nr:sulfotransferase [Thiocapsa imhoffii]MBK1646784.1 hypothetical protein [Thiocapsa imhoffii]
MIEVNVGRVFIVGAPKCGTTSLAHWLAAHPQIHMSRIKEPHYYNTDMGNRVITQKSDYDELFSDASPDAKIWCEASTWYLFSNDAVPNILAEHPDARFIAMVRDPVDMAVSLFHHNRKKLHEPLATLEEAWAAQDSRARGEGLPRNCIEPNFLQYKQACDLKNMISRLQNRVAPEKLYIIHLDDIKTDARREYIHALLFLGLKDDCRKEFPVLNEASINRSYLAAHLIRFAARLKRKLGISVKTRVAQRLNSRSIVNKPLSTATRQLIEIELMNSRVAKRGNG